jgi:hypothetical protein
LGGVLRDGLPMLAADDALETIAKVAHGDMWKPRRFATDFSNLNLDVVSASAPAVENMWKREFLVTSGRLFPTIPSGDADPGSKLTRTPPLFRFVTADALPDVL